MDSKDLFKALLADMPFQFRGGANTQILLKAFAGQLQAIYDIFAQLEVERTLPLAGGMQLDGIGDIVVMSRNEARKFAESIGSPVVMDDEEYRRYLIYKLNLNSNTTTYQDVYNMIRMFWKDSGLIYSEYPEHPATIFLNTTPLSPMQDARLLFQTPLVKAAGVAIIILATTQTDMPPVTIRAAGAVFAGISVTRLPPLVLESEFDEAVRFVPRNESVMDTLLPPIIKEDPE